MRAFHWPTVALITLLACGCARTPEHTDTHAAAKEPAKTGEMCGGFAGIGCAEGLYCDYGDGIKSARSTCGSGDQSGKCAVKPEMCTMDYSPVCGCDGRTHGNACAAHGKGITVATPGECPPQ